MKPSIANNKLNLELLNQLIENGYYKGFVKNDTFELKRIYFPNNYKIVGKLKEDHSFELSTKTKTYYMSLTLFLMTAIIVSVLSIATQTYFVPLLFVILFMIYYIFFKLKEKHEINLLIDKLLELRKKRNA